MMKLSNCLFSLTLTFILLLPWKQIHGFVSPRFLRTIPYPESTTTTTLARTQGAFGRVATSQQLCRPSIHTSTKQIGCSESPPYISLNHGNRCCRFVTLTQLPMMTSPATAAAAAAGGVQLTVGLALLHLVLGNIGTPFVFRAIQDWYTKITLPSWTPPNRIFGPVWTFLYISMGISVSRIVQKLWILGASGGSSAATWLLVCLHPSVMWWMGHMVLNVSWAPIFFGMKRLRIGLIINYALLGTLCMIIPQFAVIDAVAACLLLPYLLWLLFATALNQAICQRNPGGYNNAMFQADLLSLQRKAAKYAGL